MEKDLFEIFDNAADNLRINDDFISLDNYRIDSENCSGEYVYVFFSSHGLYFPTTYREFEDKVKKHDYYDWMNIANNPKIRKNAKKIIYVRDIYKNWYLKGINNRINDVEKLAGFILEQSEGQRIITVGSSGGGYASILLGTLVKADYIFAFSPQTDLDRYNDFHEYKYHELYTENKYYRPYINLSHVIANYKGVLNYYYPARSVEDIAMYHAVKNCNNVQFVGLNKAAHGVVINSVSLIDVLSNMDTAITAYKKAVKHSKPISPLTYLYYTSKVKGLIRMWMRQLQKMKR